MEEARDSRYFEGQRHTPEAKEVFKQLEAMLGAYNFDGSETQVDYFHVNFYGHVRVCWKLEREEKEAYQAAKVDEAQRALAVEIEIEARKDLEDSVELEWVNESPLARAF